LNYSAITSKADVSLAQDWTRSIGVASVPISVFYRQAPDEHYLRFCFAKKDNVLTEAARILCEI
jgi:methionine aminotransferase